MNKLKKGDLFRWSYNSSEYEKRKDERNSGTLYWCMSRIFRFDGEKFIDTYWGYGDNRSWTPEKAEKELDLIYLANEEDLEKTSYPEYYNGEDVVNLNHANNSKGNIYVKKSAERSKKAMFESARRKLERAESDKRTAEREVELYAKKLREIQAAEDLNEVWI